MIFNDTVVHERYKTYFHFAYAIASNYFGSYAQELNYSDFWLTEGICNSLGHSYAVFRCGDILYKYKTMKNIEYIVQRSEDGQEYYSLTSENIPKPSLLQYDDYYIKSGLVMHIVKNKVHQDNFHKILRGILKDYSRNHKSVETRDFYKICKKTFGLNLKKFLTNWLKYTGVLELTLTYEYNKKQQCVVYKIDHRNSFNNYLAKEKFLEEKPQRNQISVHNLYSNDYLKLKGKSSLKDLYTF